MRDNERSYILPKVMPVAYSCSSESSLDSLLGSARRLSKGEAFLLLLKDKETLAGRVLPAYLNAYIRYREGKMRSGSLQMELLLFISGTFKISKAISECGAERGDDFMLVGSSAGLIESYAKANRVKLRKALRLSMDVSFVPVIE